MSTYDEMSICQQYAAIDSLAGHENRDEILALLDADPDYTTDAKRLTSTDDYAQVERYSIDAGMFSGTPYTAVERTPEQWTRYLARHTKAMRFYGIEDLVLRKDGTERKLTKTGKLRRKPVARKAKAKARK